MVTKFENIYTDLDQTLVINGITNQKAIFCLQKYYDIGIPIHLITRRPTPIPKYLQEHGIPLYLFTSIKQIFNLSPKYLYILPNSIFIDDSLKERNECESDEMNIKCFDIDAFEYL